MSLKIALVCACPYPVPQGSQVFLRENALALQARGHTVHLVVYGHGMGKDESGLSLYRASCIPFARRTQAGPSWAKPFQDSALAFTLRKVVRREKIDVVIAHNYEALLVALAAGKRPVIYHAHNAMGDELPYYFKAKKLMGKVGRWLDYAFPRRADAIIAPHARLAEYLAALGCAQGCLNVIPPPLNATVFSVAEKKDALPPVLYTGNLDAYQNLELLEAAMVRVRKQLPEARLTLVTSSTSLRGHHNHFLLSTQEELKEMLQQDAVIAVPRVSWSGYPIKLLNAMAAGQAIVACESAAHPLENDYNGLIVPDNDTAAFAEAVLRCLQDRVLRARLGANARKTLQQHHHPELIAEQLEQVALQTLHNQV